jgi:hypothetical protein
VPIPAGAAPAAASAPPVITGDLAAAARKDGPAAPAPAAPAKGGLALPGAAAAAGPGPATSSALPEAETEEVAMADAPAPAETVVAASLPGAAAPSQIVGRRRRGRSLLAEADGLLLPTDFTGSLGGAPTGAVVDLYTAATGSGGPPTGPLFVIDGASKQTGRALGGIPVTRATTGCNGALFFVDTVPLPCNFVGRKAPYAPPRAAALPLPKAQSALAGAAFGLAEGAGPSLGGNGTSANATAATSGVKASRGAGGGAMVVAAAAGLAAAVLAF